MNQLFSLIWWWVSNLKEEKRNLIQIIEKAKWNDNSTCSKHSHDNVQAFIQRLRYELDMTQTQLRALPKLNWKLLANHIEYTCGNISRIYSETLRKFLMNQSREL